MVLAARPAVRVQSASPIEHDVTVDEALVLRREELHQFQVVGCVGDEVEGIIHHNLQHFPTGSPVELQAKAREIVRNGAHGKPL